MRERLEEAYAKLVLETGVALKRGQSLLVQCDTASYPFAATLARRAYAMHAKYVHIRILDSAITQARLDGQSDEELSYTPPFQKTLDEQIVRESWAYVSIEPIDDRLRGIPLDQEKNDLFLKAGRKAHKEVTDAVMSDRIPWCVVAYPTERWAKQIFGKSGSVDAL
jgi:aminopeptidase